VACLRCDVCSVGDAASDESQSGHEGVVGTVEHLPDEWLRVGVAFDRELHDLGPGPADGIVDAAAESVRFVNDEVACCKVLLDYGVGELQPHGALLLKHSVRA